MNDYIIKHHQLIRSVLNNFNADFFLSNNIYFGGGTRIALEIDEYRESVDVDFLCPNKASYRAVREEVTSASLGRLVNTEFSYAREITFDRNAVRTFIREEGANIKLEIVSFDDYDLKGDARKLFPVPCIDRETCFYTKLLANSDRFLNGQCKDIFDILAMYDAWGGLPANALSKAQVHYGSSVIRYLHVSLKDIEKNPTKYLDMAKSMLIKEEFAENLIRSVAPRLQADPCIKAE